MYSKSDKELGVIDFSIGEDINNFKITETSGMDIYINHFSLKLCSLYSLTITVI